MKHGHKRRGYHRIWGRLLFLGGSELYPWFGGVKRRKLLALGWAMAI